MPYFPKVSVEQCPCEVFIYTSAAKCWELVRQRVNKEIRKQHNLGRMDLPPLQPHGSLDAPEMFGLSSLAIIQGIETIDRNRVCMEYWKFRSQIPNSVQCQPGNVVVDPNLKTEEETTNQEAMNGSENRPSTVGIDTVFRSLSMKAIPEELHSLHNLLTNNQPNANRELLAQLLDEEIQKRPR